MYRSLACLSSCERGQGEGALAGPLVTSASARSCRHRTRPRQTGVALCVCCSLRYLTVDKIYGTRTYRTIERAVKNWATSRCPDSSTVWRALPVNLLCLCLQPACCGWSSSCPFPRRHGGCSGTWLKIRWTDVLQAPLLHRHRPAAVTPTTLL